MLGWGKCHLLRRRRRVRTILFSPRFSGASKASNLPPFDTDTPSNVGMDERERREEVSIIREYQEKIALEPGGRRYIKDGRDCGRRVAHQGLLLFLSPRCDGFSTLAAHTHRDDINIRETPRTATACV